MKRWHQYEHVPRIVAHVHTYRTDANLKINSAIYWAIMAGVDGLVFVEHIKRNPTYNWREFLREVHSARAVFPSLQLYAGFEASLNEYGTLDAPSQALTEADVVYMAEHHIRELDEAAWYEAVLHGLQEPAVDVWAHPGAGRGTITKPERLQKLLSTAAANDVALEQNTRYGAPAASWWPSIKQSGVSIVRGADAHSVADLADYVRL